MEGDLTSPPSDESDDAEATQRFATYQRRNLRSVAIMSSLHGQPILMQGGRIFSSGHKLLRLYKFRSIISLTHLFNG